MPSTDTQDLSLHDRLRGGAVRSAEAPPDGRLPARTSARPTANGPTHARSGRRRGRRAIPYSKGRAPAKASRVAGSRPQPYRSRMLARAYFQVVDAIAAACTDAQLLALRDRIALTEMHPFERRALERQLRARELALLIEL